MQLLPLGMQQFFDENGVALANGSVYFYFPNTLNPASTWADPYKNEENPNPVPLDNGGRAVIWGDLTYRQIVKNALGVTVWDEIVDSSVSEAVLAGNGGAELVGFKQNGTQSILRNVQSKLRESVSAADFQIYPDDDPSETVSKINQVLQDLSVNSNSSSELIFLDTSNSYNINSPIILRRGVSLSGPNGKKSTIKNVYYPYNFFYSSVLLPGNFHPEYIGAMATDRIEDVTTGSSSVFLVDESSVSNYQVGMQVVIQSSQGYTSSGFNIPNFLFLNEILDIDGLSVVLKYAVDRSFSGVMTGLNGTQLGRNNIPLFFWQDAEIKNLNLITSGYIHSDTATLDCKFSDLYYNGRSAFYGNSFQKTHWSRIKGKIGTVGEMSLGSLDCTIRDFDFSYDEALATPTGTAIFGFQENTRNIFVGDGKINTGSYATGAPFLNFLNTENVRIDGLDALLGAGFSGAAVQFSGVVTGGKIACKDNLVKNIRVSAENAARYYLISGDGNVGASQNNVLSDSIFYGTPTSNECGRYITAVDRHVVKGNYFESGKPLFDSTSTGCEFTENYVGDGFSVSADPDFFVRNMAKFNFTKRTASRLSLNKFLTNPVVQTGLTPLTLVGAHVGENFLPRDMISFEIRGYLSGTGAAKEVDLSFINNTDQVSLGLGTVVIAATMAGSFFIRGNIFISLLNSITSEIQVFYPGSNNSSLIEGAYTTDLSGKDLVFSIVSKCQASSDSISYRLIKASLQNTIQF